MRHGLLHLTLDVPPDDQLLDWANTPHKPLGGHVTFFEPDRRTARETVRFAAGQCVSYQETFVAGDGEAQKAFFAPATRPLPVVSKPKYPLAEAAKTGWSY